VRRKAVTVDDLAIPVSLVEKLRALNLHLADQLALFSPLDLAKALEVRLEEAEALVKRSAEAIGLRRVNLEEALVEEGVKVTTSSRALDNLLGGGVEVGVITEFYGGFASGKTQLCHQLCVNVQLPRERGGLELKAVYVDTEGSFRPERVKEMASALRLNEDDVLRNIVVFQPRSVEEQVKAVKEAGRMSRHVGLLAVDTVTNLFRVEYGDDVVERQWRLLLHLKDLEEIAAKGVAVVLANQVVSGPREMEVIPAGGVLMEAGLVKVRLSKVREGAWLAKLENSLCLPEEEVFFKVCKEGVRDLKET